MKKVFKIAAISLMATSMFIGCAGAGYQNPPTSVDSIKKEIVIDNDKFNKSIVVSTPIYLIRTGFTDTFPVMMQYKFLQNEDKTELLKITLRINDVSSGMYYDAVGEDRFKFKFEAIDNEKASTLNTTTRNGAFAYTATTDIIKDSMEIYFTFEQLEKMAKQDYQIKMYGKKKEGVFTIPLNISKSFYEKVKSVK